MNHTEVTTLHVPFAQFLDTAGIPYVRARSDRESTIAKGHPDFTVLSHGRALLIEFKTKAKGSKLSADQRKRIKELEDAGTPVHVLRDLDKAVRLVVEWRNSLGTPPAIVEHRSAPVSPELYRFGAAIFHKGSDGGFIRIRSVTPDDAHLPHLIMGKRAA